MHCHYSRLTARTQAGLGVFLLGGCGISGGKFTQSGTDNLARDLGLRETIKQHLPHSHADADAADFFARCKVEKHLLCPVSRR